MVKIVLIMLNIIYLQEMKYESSKNMRLKGLF